MERYDICVICVSHDAETANLLADSIRKYKLPRGVLIRDTNLDYRKICVDSSESAFTEEVKQLMDDSRYLVVICSPATKTSKAILDRLVYFRKVKRDEDVVAVIAEGEPIDSFPDNFIEVKTVKHILPDMSIVERTETIEPVAADLRGDTPAKRRQALRYETIRITASVLGLHPDSLEQRHRRRKNRAILTAAAIVSAVFLAASGIFIRLGWIAREEGQIAELQTAQSVIAAERLASELPQRFADDPRAMEYIQQSIDETRSALQQAGLSIGEEEEES